MKLEFDKGIVQKMTEDMMVVLDKKMYDLHHNSTMPISAYELEEVYFDTIREELPPESRAILDLNSIQKHYLGYLEEVDKDIFDKLDKFKSREKTQEPVKYETDLRHQMQTEICEGFRSIMIKQLKVLKPSNTKEVVDLYDINLTDMNPSERDKLDFWFICSDIIRYCNETFTEGLDYNLFYLGDINEVNKKGYEYFKQFKRDVDFAYENDNSWFYVYSCRDCGRDYYMRRGEVVYYLDKHLKAPKRCRDCRIKRKNKLPRTRKPIKEVTDGLQGRTDEN